MKTYAMLDGAAIGTDYDPTVDSGKIECKNPKSIWKVMEDSKHITVISKKVGKEIVARMDPKDGGSLKRTIFMDLKMDSRGRWHFNIRTNPASVFTGDNTFGSLMVVRQIKEVFGFVLDYFEDWGVNVGAMRQQVKKGHIVLSSLAFAVYSDRIRSVERLQSLMGRWYFMYETRMHSEVEYISLLEALGLARSSGDEYRDSIGLNIYGYNLGARKKTAIERGHKLMHLCLYNKAAELREKDNLAEGDSDLVDDLEHRLRFDLTVSSYFFQTAWNMKNVTLRSLYQKQKEKGGWGAIVQQLMTYAIERTCLLYVAAAPNVHAAEHRSMIALWEQQIKDKQGRALGKWDPRLETWATKYGVNLKVSPTAHLLIHQGRLGLEMNKESNIRMWLSGDTGAQEYAKLTTQAIQQHKKIGRFARAVADLRLDFSAPAYLNPNNEIEEAIQL